MIYGNIKGVKSSYLERLEQLYAATIDPKKLITEELIDELVFLSSELNREIALYIDRKGKVIQVALGEHNRVSLTELSQRRGKQSLSKIRCIHTHPGSSGILSAVDQNSLHQLHFDCMVAIGIKNGTCSDIWVGFIDKEGKDETVNYGPFSKKSIQNFDFLKVIEDLERSKSKDNEKTEKEKERALLVGVEFTGQAGEYDACSSLEELEGLAIAAGADVVEKVFQSRRKPDSAYYIGLGLVEDLALKCQALRVDLVIIDGELSGSQNRNLEKRLGVKVIDRTSLILDIFAQRAKSKEGKLQVELAQLEYLLPRLIGGVELGLSRLGGGIGTRGPGESKLEQDRRRLKTRITDLKKELQRVEERRKLLKSNRSNTIPVVALVGYTNSGKSTLRYRLLQDFADNNVDWSQEDPGTNQLFATLDPTIRRIVLPNGSPIMLADTVGFIQRLPHKLVSAFKATLEEVVSADLLLHVVDVSNPNYEEQMLAVDEVLAELGATNKNTIVVYNKMDLASTAGLYLDPQRQPSVEISALTGQGISKLLEQIQLALKLNNYEVRLAIPYSEQKLIASVHQKGKVRAIEYDSDVVILEAILNENLYLKLKPYLI